MFRSINVFFRRKSNADDGGGGRPIPYIPIDVFQNHIMNKLDDATLASAVRACPQWFSSCENDEIWRKICHSIWPSTTDRRVRHIISSGHRSFYSDSTLSPSYRLPALTSSSETSELISAVDIYYKDQVIYSKVLQTETVSDCLNDPLRLHLLGLTETVRTPLNYHENRGSCMSLAKQHLRVSWIVIDPNSKRAVNIASHKAVHSSMQENGDIDMCYATVAVAATETKLVKFAVRATCGWMGVEREIHVKRVTMEINDLKKRTLDGRESRGILQAAMKGRRRRMDSKTEECAYLKFWWMENDCMPLVIILISYALVIIVLLILSILYRNV